MGQPAKISDHVAQEIDELICDPSQLSSQAAVFDLKIDQQHYGPIEANYLKEFFLVHDELADQALIKRTHEELYVPYFEHPHFQRRKPQLVSQQSLDEVDQEYLWVLKQGQKTGPFTKSQLSEQVESSQLLRTDLISIDEGQTWRRLYELEEFDRRKLESNHLPPTPQGQVFVESLRETRIQLASSDNQREEAEALTGLAYIGNLKNGKGVEGEKKVPRPLGAQVEMKEFSSPKTSVSQNQQWPWYALFGVSLVGILALILTWQTSGTQDKSSSSQSTQDSSRTQMAKEVEPQQNLESKQNENTQAPLEARRPASPNRERAQLRQRRQPLDIGQRKTTTRSQTSFRESQAYRETQQERQMLDDPASEDGYYYDEGDVPPEQDPIRRQLTRETTDPRNSWADDLESIQDDPEYYDEGYVEPGVYPEDELYEEY